MSYGKQLASLLGALLVAVALSLLAPGSGSAVASDELGDPIYNDDGYIVAWYCSGECVATEWCCCDTPGCTPSPH